MMDQRTHVEPTPRGSCCPAPRAAVTALRRAFRTPVRGHVYAPRLPGSSPPVPGQLARLVREPTNPADDLAVGVWVADAVGRWRIGYLDRTVAARVAPRLDAGEPIAARIDGWTGEPGGRWQRPLLVLLPEAGADMSEAGADMSTTAERAVPLRPATSLWGRPPGVSRRVLGEDRRGTSRAS